MSILSHKVRVGVLRGGPSSEYQESLNTGRTVLDNLSREIYEPIDVFISRDGTWHEDGFEKMPEKIIRKSDVLFNALHGRYGEDGTVQKLLDSFGVPYTGSQSIGSIFGLNKVTSKKIYKNVGIKTPFAVSINSPDLTREAILSAYKTVPSPFVVKPATSGSSLGLYIVDSLPELEEAAVAALEYSPTVIIEEFINGKEAYGGVIDEWRNQNNYSLIPVSEHSLSTDESSEISRLASLAHSSLGLRHYSSSDFIIHPKRGIFILETDTLPTIHSKSKFSRSLEAIGSKLSDFLHHVISLARGK